MNNRGEPGGLKIKTLPEGFWRVGCSYNRAVADGQDWGVTLATPNCSSPLQAIEKKRLKSVPNLTFARPFFDGQAFGRNRKLLGNCSARRATTGEHFRGIGSI